VSASAVDRAIRSLRPAKPFVDPFRAHGTVLERERRPDGRIERTLTVFLAGAECPFTCSFCDLWRWTIDGPTPPGALTRQLAEVLDGLNEPTPQRLKLYNASNFFDRRAVPPEDVDGLARLASSFAAVTVESHASTIGGSTLAFARRLAARLEVAVGLETIHPDAAARLNKRLDLPRFDRAAAFLREHDVDLRAFVLLGAPHVASAETVEWTVRTAEYAAARGAAVVSIIPVRGGNGELERLQALGEFTPPALSQLEEALDRCLHVTRAVVTADLWDAGRLASCELCRAARIARLERINLTGCAEPRVPCPSCEAR
jgi:radical SAM enzyme (TIGR01210 family)